MKGFRTNNYLRTDRTDQFQTFPWVQIENTFRNLATFKSDIFSNFCCLLGIYQLYEFNHLFGYLLRIRLAPMTSSLGKLATYLARQFQSVVHYISIPRFTLLMWGHIKKTRKAKTV